MSRSTKKQNDKCKRRSALSFDICANGSLDDEHILASEPWKNIKIFETSEAAAIQNVLDEFNNIITQEKALKVKDRTTTTKKVSPRSTKKSPIKISAMDLPGTSSGTNSNANSGETKTINKNKRTSTKPRQTSIDNVKEETFQNISKAKENVNSMEETITTEILQDIMNITNCKKSPRTSTPKKEKLTAENKKPKTKNSENKSEESAQSKKKQEKLKKDTEDKQGENSANMLGKNRKTNVKSENNLESKVNKKSSKNKVEDKKAECCATLLSEKMEKTRDVVEISKKREESAKSKECNKSQLKRKNLKKDNPEDKLQKGVQPHKSSKPSGINDAENAKCQCKESCVKYSDNQCSSEAKKHVKKRREHKKNIKAARDIEDLSRRITAVKRKMECIKNDLESNESFDSSYTDSSSDSSSDSSCSCTSSYICADCDTSDYSEYTYSSDSSNSRETAVIDVDENNSENKGVLKTSIKPSQS